MEKDEVLKRSRNSKQDEGAEFADNQGRKLGVVLFATVSGVIAIFSITQHDTKTLYATLALLFTFSASISYGKFYFANKKIYMIGAIVYAIAAILFLANFFLISLR